MEGLATLLVMAVGGYLVIGVLFAAPFVVRGVGAVDPDAARGTIGFRILVFPASVALWPLLLRRWWRGGGPPTERNAHRDGARRDE